MNLSSSLAPIVDKLKELGVTAEESNVSEDTTTTNINSTETSIVDEQDETATTTNIKYPYEFLLRIPKADLHIHLDGSIRVSTLIDLAKEQDIYLPSYDEVELKQMVFPPTYKSLVDYLAGFGYITKLLSTKQALERVAYEVAMDAYNNGVRYIEVRFAPQLHAIPGKLSIEEIICAVNLGLERAVKDADELDKLSGEEEMYNNRYNGEYNKDTVDKLEMLFSGKVHPYNAAAPPHHYGIICCAMRFFLPDTSPYYQAFWEVHTGEDQHRVFGLASVALVTAINNLREKGKCCHGCGSSSIEKEQSNDYILPIVAVDVAGAESGYPASDHKEAFDLAHQGFLNKTVHAGEAYGAESIYSAITDLHAERIGHGCNVFKWEIIGEGEGRGGRSKSNKEKDEISDEEKQAYVENLTRYLGGMRTCFEVCLSSNLQTMPELNGDLRGHPARKMIQEELAVTFCTDNTLVSHTDMVKELTLAAEAFALSPGQLRNCVYNGFKRSFMATKRYRAKRDYNRKVISYYKKVESEFGFSGYSTE